MNINIRMITFSVMEHLPRITIQEYIALNLKLRTRLVLRSLLSKGDQPEKYDSRMMLIKSRTDIGLEVECMYVIICSLRTKLSMEYSFFNKLGIRNLHKLLKRFFWIDAPNICLRHTFLAYLHVVTTVCRETVDSYKAIDTKYNKGIFQ